MWLAAFHGHVEVMRVLLVLGDADLEARSAEQVLSLRSATENGPEIQVTRGPYRGSTADDTPLFIAAEQGHTQVYDRKINHPWTIAV